MNEARAAWDALRYGGAMVYPLLFLGVVAVLIILDRAVFYCRCFALAAFAGGAGRDLRLFLGRARSAVNRSRQ
jgi:hypothetical protein